jgi:hypothetical protein
MNTGFGPCPDRVSACRAYPNEGAIGEGARRRMGPCRGSGIEVGWI